MRSEDERLAGVRSIKRPKKRTQSIGEIAALALFDDIPMVCVAISSSGNILAVNTYGSSHLGYRPIELIGHSFHTIVHSEDIDETENQRCDAVVDCKRAVRREMRMVSKDRSTCWVWGTIRPIPNSAGGSLLICEDVSERNTTIEKLAQDQSRLESLTVTALLAEERERRRIANGLHDQVGHSLALAKIKTTALCASVNDAKAQKIIADIGRCLDETIKVTRALIFDLSSPVLYALGLEAALETLIDRVEEQTKLRTQIVRDSMTIVLPENTAVVVYRVIDELVFNVVKHASARNLRICVHQVDQDLVVSVDDDGVGLVSYELEEHPGPYGRYGLFSTRTRIAQLGGQFDIGPSDMGGVRANLIVPIVVTDEDHDGP